MSFSNIGGLMWVMLHSFAEKIKPDAFTSNKVEILDFLKEKIKMMIVLQKNLLRLAIFISMMLFLVPTENRLLFIKLQNT